MSKTSSKLDKEGQADKQGKPRTLVISSPHRTTGGGFFEGLTADDAEYESHNESNALNTLLLCHDVRKIASQPLKEPYILDGIERFYTPDFVVDAFEPSIRLEVKSIGYLLRKESDWEKYLAIAASYWNRGLTFAFLVDAQLEMQPRFGNVKLFVRYVTSKLPMDILNRATAALMDGPKQVAEFIEVSGLALVDVLTLIAKRELCIDWNVAFDRTRSMVSLPGQPYEGLKLENVLRSSRYGDFLAQLALGRREADKRILANSQTWRRHHNSPEPCSMVGGFVELPPLRTLREEECLPRNFNSRKNFAPGKSDIKADNSRLRGKS